MIRGSRRMPAECYTVELPAGPLGLSLQANETFDPQASSKEASPSLFSVQVTLSEVSLTIMTLPRQVDEVLPDGTAAKEAPRIRNGDLITKINDESVRGMDFSKTTSVLKVCVRAHSTSVLLNHPCTLHTHQGASRPLTMEFATWPAEEFRRVETKRPNKQGKRAESLSYEFEFTSKSLGLALQPIPTLQQQLHRQEGGQLGFMVQVETLLADGAAAQCGLISPGKRCPCLAAKATVYNT